MSGGSIPVDISNFSREDLMQLALLYQQRAMHLSTYLEVMQAKIDGMTAENTALRSLLSKEIIGVMVHTPNTTRTIEDVIQNATLVEPEGKEETPSEEKSENVVEKKDKDKFQA